MNDQPRCPLCQATSATPLGMFSFLHCPACDLRFVWPRPPRHALRALYADTYEPHWIPLNREPRRWRRLLRRRHQRLRCRLVARARPAGGLLLDAGCGSGGFLRELNQLPGWRGIGLDLSPAALRWARLQGVAAVCAAGETPPLRHGSLQGIALWEVVEHLPDPLAALRALRRCLGANGVLLLSTPNGAAWLARLAGSGWPGWDTPRHLQLFSRPSLARLLAAAGFQPPRYTQLPLERFYVHGVLRHRLPAAAAQGVAWLGWPLWRLVDHLPGASSLVAIAAVDGGAGRV